MAKEEFIPMSLAYSSKCFLFFPSPLNPAKDRWSFMIRGHTKKTIVLAIENESALKKNTFQLNGSEKLFQFSGQRIRM